MKIETTPDLTSAKCLALYLGGVLQGYITRDWDFGKRNNGQWERWPRCATYRRARDKGRDISDWDVGNERLLRGGYTLVPVDESEAIAKLAMPE